MNIKDIAKWTGAKPKKAKDGPMNEAEVARLCTVMLQATALTLATELKREHASWADALAGILIRSAEQMRMLEDLRQKGVAPEMAVDFIADWRGKCTTPAKDTQ